MWIPSSKSTVPLEHPSLCYVNRYNSYLYKWGHQESETSMTYPRSYIQVEASKRRDNVWLHLLPDSLLYTVSNKGNSLLLSSNHCISPPDSDFISYLFTTTCFKVYNLPGGDKLLQPPDTLILKTSLLYIWAIYLWFFQQILLILNCQQCLVYVMCVTVKNSFCPASMGKEISVLLFDGMNIQGNLGGSWGCEP